MSSLPQKHKDLNGSKSKPLIDDKSQEKQEQKHDPMALNDSLNTIADDQADEAGMIVLPQINDHSVSMSIEDADTPVKMMKLHGPSMICLWITLFIVDISLIISTSLYLVRHDTNINEHSDITYRSIGDIFSFIYRLLVISLCIKFMRELLQGTITKSQAEELNDPELNILADKPRTASTYNWYEKLTYFFKELELNQFTIAAVLCATHQLYNAALLWIAVYSGSSKWYILSGCTYFLGAFSIAIPGICFNQFVIYRKKQKRGELHSDYDEQNTMITGKSKLAAIKITIFADPFVQLLIFIGFLIELIQFCCVPTLNHDDIIIMQNIIYHCEDIGCDQRPDFVLCELVFRLFVGMAIFNNLVLLGSVLSEQIHSETSLTNITKIFNPICYVFLLLALLMDLRITDDYWNIEYHVVNWFWISIHIGGILIILKLLCGNLYNLNHQIVYPNKRRDIKATKSLFIEALSLTVFAFLSTLFISFDQKILEDFWKHSNLRIWRQWIMIIYHFWQIPALYFVNRIQKFDSFATKLGKPDDYEGIFAVRSCFVWIGLINLYDFMYSFMFESREYDQVMNGDEIISNDHSDINLYKWSYSLSFAVSHLILWSLCCAIEFIVKYDEIIYQEKQNKKIGQNINNNNAVNGYQQPPRKISMRSNISNGIDHEVSVSKSEQKNRRLGSLPGTQQRQKHLSKYMD